MDRLVRSVSWRRGLACAVALVFVVGAHGARADVASDQPAAILVFPKIVVDTSTPPQTPRGRVDTLVRISNTSTTRAVSAHCFWVNVNGHCKNSQGTICNPRLFAANSPCGPNGYCEPGWQETDFDITMTAGQPIAWLASRGEAPCDSQDTSGLPCLPLPANQGSRIPGVSEDPFIGELKCIEVDKNGVPVASNDLKGEAEIVESNAGQIDVEGYNAIGIPATGSNNGDYTLVLGGPNAEYSSCPNILILDHFFDGANDPISGDSLTTELTLVPCSEDFQHQSVIKITVQFLVFNEFEQRLSTSRPVTCFDDVKISNIDTRSSANSIFNAAVMGTLTGQTRIRGVPDSNAQCTAAGTPFACCTGSGTGTCNGTATNSLGANNALLGIAEEFRDGGGSAAFNLHFNGTRPTSDFIYLPTN
jgi:hypothetical protein